LTLAACLATLVFSAVFKLSDTNIIGVSGILYSSPDQFDSKIIECVDNVTGQINGRPPLESF